MTHKEIVETANKFFEDYYDSSIRAIVKSTSIFKGLSFEREGHQNITMSRLPKDESETIRMCCQAIERFGRTKGTAEGIELGKKVFRTELRSFLGILDEQDIKELAREAIHERI